MNPVPSTPPLVRRRSGRLVAGVAGGVADHLGVDVLWVRAGFLALAVLSGAGVVAYALLWMFVRQEHVDVLRVVPRAERQQAVGLAALGVAIGLVGAALGDTMIGWVVGPLGVAAVGAALVWREADETQRRRWTAPHARTGAAAGGRTALLRVLAGALFVATGIAVFLLGNVDLGQVQFGLLAVLATLVGVAVLTVPWWVRLMRDLGEERRQRIVEAERAEIAAHLHDSVLQTLALIQRQSDQPREVTRLARGQERELRHWLYGADGYSRPPGTALDAGLSDALAAAAAEVEDTYAVTVQPVVVGGDRKLDDGLRALVLAAREAMVNAAKHAGVAEVSVYAEVEPEEVHVFVRDRGSGFDVDTVPTDRHGLADSVLGRMARHGGTAQLRTAPGEGTEVHLAMPRDGAAADPRAAATSQEEASDQKAASDHKEVSDHKATNDQEEATA
ncbi:MAG: PspC domain-containing protein [Pseudonocardia sp.]